MSDHDRDAQARATADAVARRSYGKLVAFLAARTRDVAAAEDALSEAFIRGRIRGGVPIEVGVKDGGLWYQQGDEGGALSS